MKLSNNKAASLLSGLSTAMLMGLVLLAAGCKQEQKAPASSAPPEVVAVKVNPQDFPVEFEYVAQTQSSQLVDIHARVSGFLDRRLYTEGTMVKAGQVLFQLDPKPFQAQLDEAKAAQSRQEASLEVARLNLNRVKSLTAQGVTAQRDLDDATGQFQSASAAVEQAKAQVETAKLNLSYTTISSPVDGISSSAVQAEGTYINLQNSLLTSVAVLTPMWVNFSISENEIQKYRDQMAKGQLHAPKDGSYEVEIVLVDGSVFPHTGRITFAEPSYNAQTGTFLIRTSVDNPDGTLRPNQFVHARLKGAVRPNAIVVPQRSVQESSKGQFVWVVGEGNKIEQRPVTVGSWYKDQWFIAEGLESGEQVVADGGLTLQPGVSVAVKPSDAGAQTASASETKTSPTPESGK